MRGLLKGLVLALVWATTTMSFLAVAAAPATAQGWRDQYWEDWNGPRRWRGEYDRRRFDYDAEDPRYAPRDRPWYDDDNDEDYAPRARVRRPRFDDEEFDDRARGRAGEDGTDQDGRVTWNGGGRPAIAPKAPAKTALSARHAPGSVVIDTRARRLYYVISPAVAYAYPIGVGREGFSWTGTEKISRIADWPDWYPPAEMRQRRPELPERMLGGINNPLGAKALYLGNTLYRIHGTNEPKSIGRAESSGCFRMLNAHVLHLASLVKVGTEVSVVRSMAGQVARSER